MNPSNPSTDPDLESPQVGKKPNFLKLFTVGTLSWIGAFVVLFAVSWGVSNPENLSNAILWASSRWWISFLVGLLGLVIYGLASGSSFALAARAYILPTAIVGLLSWICHMIYPDSSFRGDLVTFLPIIVVFYAVACGWMMLSKEATATSNFGRAVIPGILGGLVILGFVAVPALTSNEFRYRNAFQFTITKMAVLATSIQAEGNLTITKLGQYDFTSPRFFSVATNAIGEPDPQLEVGEITWGASGEPQPGATGTFPMKIAWKRTLLPANFSTIPFADDSVYLEVRDPDTDNELIYSLFAPVTVSN